MKLKLTDKIRKFFGQAEHQEADAVLDGDVPAYGGSLEASVANLAALKPSAARHETHETHQQHIQVQQRPGCQPLCQDQLHAGGAAAEKQAASQLQLQQHHGQHTPHITSCTNSQKDAKDFCSGLRTTGQDESYTLQNEVYFPQLLLTLQGGTPEQKAVAAEALFNYTAESDAARQRATQAGVVAHLVDLLRTGTEHGKMYAAYTLSSLTTIDESLEQMHKHGAIPALIDILSTCPLLVCKKGAMRALGRLARSDDAAQEIVAAGGLGPIISLLSRPDSSLVRRCLIALYFIGADKDSLQQAIGAAGALPQLLQLVRSDSPDVQAEATDVLKVLCRNTACGRMLAELSGIEVLVCTAQSGLTSRAKAAATRALQRLHDIPELKEALSSSTARDLQPDASMSPAHSSQLNSSTAAPTAAAFIAAATAGSPQAAAPLQSPAAAAAASAPAQVAAATGQTAASAGGNAVGVQNVGSAPGPGFTVSGSQPEDLKQLAQVLTAGSSRWLREKAAAAVEQLATDNPAACRDLVGLGVLPALLDMLDASNSGSTRRAAARALGQLSDDAVLLVGMADPIVVGQLLLAAPQLAGSAQQGVMRVLHSLASVPNAVTTCFQRQQAVHSMMQVLDSNPAGATATAAAEGVQRSTMSGSSASSGPDTGVTSRALEVMLAVCRSDALALQEIKDHPGGFKLLVSQLQHGQRSTASLILQLLAVLAQHKQHQEDLLKCGVVPTLLLMYRSEDRAVALQAARIMESLSEPASTILQRSLSASNSRMPDSSSDTSASSTPTAAAGTPAGEQQASASAGSQQAGPQQAGSGPKQQQDLVSSSSSEANADYVTGGSYSSSAWVQAEPSTAAAAAHQQPQEPSLSPLGHQSKAGSRPNSAPSPRQPGVQGQEPSALGKPSNTMAAASSSPAAAQPAASSVAQQDTPSSTAATAVAAGTSAAAEEPTVQLTAVSRKASLEVHHQPPRRTNSSSPPRRVAAAAAALEAAALASAGSSVGDTSLPLPPSPSAGRARQSSIPLPNRNGRQTPTGLGSAPLVMRRPSKSEPPSDLQQQQQQPRQQEQQPSACNKDQREESSPSTPSQQPQQQQQQNHAQQEALQQEVQQPQQQSQHQQQQQHRMQQQMPSRLPRRLPVAPGSTGSGAAGGSSSSPGATPDPSGSRTSTPDPMKRKQHIAAAAAGVSKVPSGSTAGGSSSPASGRSPSASAVHLRVLAAQKQSQRNLSAAGEASSEAPAAAMSAAPGTSQQQQQQPCEGTGSGRVMQMAAALAANAEAAAARSPTPEHARQPAQTPPQQQQQQQQQDLQAKQEKAAAASAAEAAGPAGASSSSPSSSSRPSSASSPSRGERQAAPANPSAAAAAAGSSQANACQPGPSPTPAAAALGQDRVRPSAAAAGSPAAAEADDLLSSTYDNLHGLLLKKGDIEICRTAEGRKCRLGEGGFGIVYKAVMNGVDEVAVKLVKAETPSRKELELFLKEVQTLAKLHHRNIVQFYGACLEMGSMFFVTELMKGGDLYSALRHHAETMKWERLGRKVALDVALGLNYLHAQRPPMMHRDLKSPNVLLSEEGVAKIADVGMVRSQVKDLVTAQPVMTPLWAAPEVVRHERASIKADIWSYGILIWELVTGEDITEYQPLSISRQVGPSPNAKAMALPARCPAVARKLFVACTQMDPERRPCAQQLVEWLRADIAQSRH